MNLLVEPIAAREAAALVVAHHYLHRRPTISHAYGLRRADELGPPLGAVVFGTPASRHVQMGACPTDPALVVELNRLWVDDTLGPNTESWFVARALAQLPPRIVVSYADPQHGHVGYIYRALNFHYAGWTDMDRQTPRWDYLPADPTQHSREASRSGYVAKRRRTMKVRYWTVTGNRTDRRRLTALCGWPQMDWRITPPPLPENFGAPIAPPTAGRA